LRSPFASPKGNAICERVIGTIPRHRLPAGTLVLAKSVLGGLHHEYFLEAASAAV
jgi:hypothetical protein